MYFRRLLKNIHLSLIVADLHKKELKQFPGNMSISHSEITNILRSYNLAFALCVPYFVARIAIYALRRRITGEDVYLVKPGDTIGQLIYSVLSEAEWCDEFVLWLRILVRTERFYIKNGTRKEVQIPSQEVILQYLLLSEGFLCQRRQETKDEYTQRKLDELNPEETGKNTLAFRKKFERQFDLILSAGNGNALKEYCLGRKFRFLKIPKEARGLETQARKGIFRTSGKSTSSF